MMKEWLEEQLARALEREDAYEVEITKKSAEIEWLKMHIEDQENRFLKLMLKLEEYKAVIESLLPIDKDGDCVMCQDELPNDNIHTDGSLCLEHPYYAKALEVLDAD